MFWAQQFLASLLWLGKNWKRQYQQAVYISVPAVYLQYYFYPYVLQ